MKKESNPGPPHISNKPKPPPSPPKPGHSGRIIRQVILTVGSKIYDKRD